MFLYANLAENQEIQADFESKIISKNKKVFHAKHGSKVFENRNGGSDNWGFLEFIEWRTLENEYLDDGKLEVEVHVKINKMIGFRKELRSFGEKMKQFSDVILKVKERKFYVSKMYLSSHSPYFATLFLGKFQESEIELKHVDPYNFQYYLEVLYLENGIDDDTVDGILSVADKFDTPIIVQKCEEFLIKDSKMELIKKLKLSESYNMEELKKLCLNMIKSEDENRYQRTKVKWTRKFFCF